MNLLLISATHQESHFVSYRWPEVKTVVTGVGLVNTTYYLAKYVLSDRPDLVIQIGIAGTFLEQQPLGSLVLVQKDCLGDFGAQDKNQFLTSFELGLENKNQFPYNQGWLINPHSSKFPEFKQVSAITVQTASGEENTIERRLQMFKPEIESMEGFASAYVCAQEKIPFLQLRAISNKVEVRNRQAWDIPLALNRLEEGLNELISLIKQRGL